MTKEIPDTSIDFDDCIGYKETEGRPATLSSLLGLSDVPESVEEAEKEHNYMNWRKDWVGMPSFESKNLEQKYQLQINFDSFEDLQAFSELVDQKLTAKTKSIWYPEKNKDSNALKRWIDDSE